MLEVNSKIIEIIKPKVIVGDTAYIEVRLDTGKVVRRIGNRNWRNNNPGNIEYGIFARANGAIGSDGTFAVFPDYKTGRAAKKVLLFKDEKRGYKSLTITKAIYKWSPRSPNPALDNPNVEKYARLVISAVGGDFVLSQLTEDQQNKMMDAMEKFEGFKIGSIEVVNQPNSSFISTSSSTNLEQEKINTLNQEIKNITEYRDALTAEIKNRNHSNSNSPRETVQAVTNTFPHLWSVFTLIEFAPSLMIRKINEQRKDEEINNNLKYSLNPLEAKLSLPGISGIRIGELIRLGRLPKRLFESKGAWQIMGITDSISSEGWITNIRCRFMPLPSDVVKQLSDV